MTFAFIDAEKAVYPVRRLCTALAVSGSGYYAWRGRAASTHAVVDQELRGTLRLAHAESHGRYGSPRLHQQLRQTGIFVSRKRIIRLMRAEGLEARRRRRFRVTTDSTHRLATAPITCSDGLRWRRRIARGSLTSPISIRRKAGCISRS